MTERDDLFESARIAALPDGLRVPLERALASWRAGDLAGAKASCDAALHEAIQTANPFGVFHALHLRACVAYGEADYVVARVLHVEVLRRCHEMDFLGGMGSSLCDLAMIDLAEGDVDAARIRYERGLACLEDGGYAEHAAAAREMWAATANVA